MKFNDTLVVNLWGGPCSGKSTMASRLFSELKSRDVSCEFVSEFAKDLVWENNIIALNTQMYVTGTQIYKICRCLNSVDIVITDSPILLGSIYNKEDNPHLEEALLWEYFKFNNMNFFINRPNHYENIGRIHDKEEAEEIDTIIKAKLKLWDIDYTEIRTSEESVKPMVDMVMEWHKSSNRLPFKVNEIF